MISPPHFEMPNNKKSPSDLCLYSLTDFLIFDDFLNQIGIIPSQPQPCEFFQLLALEQQFRQLVFR